MLEPRPRTIAVLLLLLASACSDDSTGTTTPADAGTSTAEGGSSGSPTPSPSSDAGPDSAAPSPSGHVFTIDGQPSTSQDKISVSTFKSDRIAINFGIQALSAPTDYTFLLTYYLDETKTGSGTFGMEAVTRVEGLLRDANTAATFSGEWTPANANGVEVTLSVASDEITASWKGGASGGGETHAVEARTTDLPSNKK